MVLPKCFLDSWGCQEQIGNFESGTVCDILRVIAVLIRGQNLLIWNSLSESLSLLHHQYQVPGFIIFLIHMYPQQPYCIFSTSRTSLLIEICLFSSRLLSGSSLLHPFPLSPAAYSRGFGFLFLPRNPAVIFMESARSLRRAETAIAMPKAAEACRGRRAEGEESQGRGNEVCLGPKAARPQRRSRQCRFKRQIAKKRGIGEEKCMVIPIVESWKCSTFMVIS